MVGGNVDSGVVVGKVLVGIGLEVVMGGLEVVNKVGVVVDGVVDDPHSV